MQNIPKISRILLFVSALSFIIWYGGYFTRLISLFQLFDPGSSQIDKSIFEYNLDPFFNVLAPSLILGIVTYSAFIFTFFGFLITSKLNIKSEGWLFIIVILIGLTLPFEAFLIFLDWQTINNIYVLNSNNTIVINLIEKRFNVLGSFPIIEIFLYIAVVFLFLLQPLKMNKNEN